MARATTAKTVSITLVLTEREAEYLGALTQNYLGADLEDEPGDERKMREDIFETIKEALQ